MCVLIYADSKRAHSSKSSGISSKVTLPSSMILTPKQASSEFGFLMVNIIEELSKNEAVNLEKIKIMCSCLTVEQHSGDLFFNEEQQDAIDACNSIRRLFTKNLRDCWRWDDYSFLKNIVQSLDSSDHCKQLLGQYEKKIYIQMKLQDVYNYCQQEKQNLPDGCHKMVAIVQDRMFSQITLQEYNELKDFICKHCKVEPYVISPLTKGAVSSLLLEWMVPPTAVPHMIKMAVMNVNMFIAQKFIYLKISTTVILEKRNNVRKLKSKKNCIHS